METQRTGGTATAVGRKSTLYREVNLATATLLAEYGSDDVAHFLCECDDAACRRRLELRRDEFETARQAGGRLVSPECVGDAPVLRRGDRFVVIAELEGR